jgi:hypothetical protein
MKLKILWGYFMFSFHFQYFLSFRAKFDLNMCALVRRMTRRRDGRSSASLNLDVSAMPEKDSGRPALKAYQLKFGPRGTLKY